MATKREAKAQAKGKNIHGGRGLSGKNASINLS
jgi:hypothetical protein